MEEMNRKLPVKWGSLEVDLGGVVPGRKPKAATHNRETELMRRIVCWNQGAYLDYSVVSSSLHRNLKDLVNRGSATAEKIYHKKILEDFIYQCIMEACRENTRSLARHFSDRVTKDGCKPRISIKVPFYQDGHDQVRTLYRDRPVRYDNVSNCRIEDNLGFKFIFDNGSYFLCNDIPKASAANHDAYFNPRLDPSSARDYVARNKWRRTMNRDAGIDDQWCRCWRNADGSTIHSENGYKSTLIIPITLWNNQVSPELKKRVAIDTDSGEGRSIYGFVCFDHRDRHFFNSTTDVDYGYVIADLLSLYFIHYLKLCQLSSVITQLNNETASVPLELSRYDELNYDGTG